MNPASQNFDAEWFRTFGKLGFEVVALTFAAQQGSAIWQHPKIEEALDLELKQADTGSLDSSAFMELRQWHFFHVPNQNLGAAIRQLKASIESRGLLSIAEIYHGESSTEWRQWHPSTAALAVTESVN